MYQQVNEGGFAAIADFIASDFAMDSPQGVEASQGPRQGRPSGVRFDGPTIDSGDQIISSAADSAYGVTWDAWAFTANGHPATVQVICEVLWAGPGWHRA